MCEHLQVHRSTVEYSEGRRKEWFCDDCGCEFYHLDFDLSAQKITVMEPQVTLRDQFAMAAMIADAVQSAVISAAYIGQGKRLDSEFPRAATGAAEYYETAEAMLEARK